MLRYSIRPISEFASRLSLLYEGHDSPSLAGSDFPHLENKDRNIRLRAHIAVYCSPIIYPASVTETSPSLIITNSEYLYTSTTRYCSQYSSILDSGSWDRFMRRAREAEVGRRIDKNEPKSNCRFCCASVQKKHSTSTINDNGARRTRMQHHDQRRQE